MGRGPVWGMMTRRIGGAEGAGDSAGASACSVAVGASAAGAARRDVRRVERLRGPLLRVQLQPAGLRGCRPRYGWSGDGWRGGRCNCYR